MKTLLTLILTLFVTVRLFSAVPLWKTDSLPPRKLTFIYTCYLSQLPTKAKKMNLWIPVPTSNDRQTVQLVSVDSKEGKFTIEKKYGNRMYFRQFILKKFNPTDTVKITFFYEITVQEKSVPEAKSLTRLPKTITPKNLEVYLHENELIPLDGAIAKRKQQLDLPDEPILAARKIYDHLIDTMVYNYKAPGAGFGDAVWACSSLTGDCSDYHSVFIGVCRSASIPADHAFGIPLRTKAGKGQAKDWHCWAKFWVEKAGWITIDASEADKHPEQKEYLFGTLSNVYLELSHGRDVFLNPKQKMPALNIFADPHAEVDGKLFKNVKWIATFEEKSEPEK